MAETQSTNQPAQSGVAALVQSKLTPAAAGGTQSVEPKKFIVYLKPEDKIKLDAIAKVTNTGKIDLASQLMAISLNDAFKQCQVAGKIDKAGNVVEDKPATPVNAPTPPAAPAATK